MPRYEYHKTGRIYGLIDPRDQEIKYIGSTSKSLNARLAGHRTSHGECARHLWIRDVQSSGYQPEIFEIEKLWVSKLAEAEKFWISYFKMLGANLTNMPTHKRVSKKLKLPTN